MAEAWTGWYSPAANQVSPVPYNQGPNLSNPTNMYINDANLATWQQSKTRTSDWVFHNFGAAIPASHYVWGVEVRVNQLKTASTPSPFEVKLIDLTNNAASSEYEWSPFTFAASFTQGGQEDRWNAAWVDKAAVESSNFGVVLGINSLGASNVDCSHVEVRFYYKDTPPPAMSSEVMSSSLAQPLVDEYVKELTNATV